MRSFQSQASREKTSEPVFEEKHKNAFWTKTKKHERVKSLSTTYKTLKNFFEFDEQVLKHTHHI